MLKLQSAVLINKKCNKKWQSLNWQQWPPQGTDHSLLYLKYYRCKHSRGWVYQISMSKYTLNTVSEGYGLDLWSKQIILFAVKKCINKFLRSHFFSDSMSFFTNSMFSGHRNQWWYSIPSNTISLPSLGIKDSSCRLI